jgi:ribonuclease HI
MQNSPTLIEVFCDGSGNTMKSDGGFGWRVVVDGKMSEEGSGYAPVATNNTMELQAAIEGLKRAETIILQNGWQMAKVVLVSDSQLCLGYASDKWRCKAEHLRPLKNELVQIFSRLDAETRWVRGHSNDEHNEACDKLAGNARKNKGATQ